MDAKRERPQQQPQQPASGVGSFRREQRRERTETSENGAVRVVEKRQLKAKEERNDSLNLDTQIKRLSLRFSNADYERQFRSSSDSASCISLVGFPITLLCALLAHLYLYKP